MMSYICLNSNIFITFSKSHLINQGEINSAYQESITHLRSCVKSKLFITSIGSPAKESVAYYLQNKFCTPIDTNNKQSSCQLR
jgi:hypothetical protein